MWSAEEENFLKSNWINMDIHKITKELNAKFKNNRTECAVSNKIEKSGLLKEFKEESITRKEARGRDRSIQLQYLKNQIKENDTLKLRIVEERERKRIIVGTVLHKTNNLIVIKGERYRESFMYSDFLIGKVAII
jgi:hypothetical protein